MDQTLDIKISIKIQNKLYSYYRNKIQSISFKNTSTDKEIVVFGGWGCCRGKRSKICSILRWLKITLGSGLHLSTPDRALKHHQSDRVCRTDLKASVHLNIPLSTRVHNGHFISGENIHHCRWAGATSHQLGLQELNTHISQLYLLCHRSGGLKLAKSTNQTSPTSRQPAIKHLSTHHCHYPPSVSYHLSEQCHGK